jgi:hypothetical protein
MTQVLTVRTWRNVIQMKIFRMDRDDGDRPNKVMTKQRYFEGWSMRLGFYLNRDRLL